MEIVILKERGFYSRENRNILIYVRLCIFVEKGWVLIIVARWVVREGVGFKKCFRRRSYRV